jgi:hypothetical protein
MWWRIAGGLLALVVALTVIGFVLRALRWLLVVALIVAVLSAIAGSLGRSERR